MVMVNDKNINLNKKLLFYFFHMPINIVHYTYI